MARFVTFTDLAQDKVGVDSKAVRVVERVDSSLSGSHTAIMMTDNIIVKVLEPVDYVVATLNDATDI